MANDQDKKAKPAQAAAAAAPPEGLEDIGLPDVDGWYKPELMKDEWLQFKILGSIKIKDKKRNTLRDVVIATVGKTGATVQSPEDKDVTVRLKLGDVIGVGIRAKLKDLLDYRKDSVFWIKPRKRKDIGGGNTMWTWEGPRLERGVKKTADDLKLEAARRPVTAGDFEAEDAADDIPF